MIIDIHELEKNTLHRADICVIGSGAAGITLAREFIETSHSIIVLEAGGNLFEEPSQDPYRSSLVGLPHGGVNQGRVRVLGGSTTLWAGQALPLFDIDFSKREWVPHSGWPIDKKTLDPYYRRAEDVMQIPHSTNDCQSWPVSQRVEYDPDDLVGYYSQFTSIPDFSRKYRAALSSASNICLFTHANVVSLEANPNGSLLQMVKVRSLDGHSVCVQARYFALCCGGIETARLLLASDSVEQNGIGNQHDVVGRYFQDHPGVALPVRPTDAKKFSAYYDSARRDGIRYSIKIAASERLQRKERMLHIGGEIYYPLSNDNPISAAKDLIDVLRHPRKVKHFPSVVARVARRPDKVVGAAYRYYVRGIPPSVGSTIPHIGFGGEQQPNPHSRVMLSQERDVLGMRRTALDWRLTSFDSQSICTYIKTVATAWKRMGIAFVDPDGIQLMGREKGENGGYVDANHHMGTTRMGSDVKTSVVDARCRVHGYDNLYVGSSSVFPTGGFSNPTLTVIALCLRISDELKQNLANYTQ
jgi:choline dehydrogenase-like flavoprotein